MVVTSHPLAVKAGLDALTSGGTAADAAVAAAAVLCVVDPRSTGIGGDACAQYWAPGDPAPTGLVAAGPAPEGLSIDALRSAGFSEMPTAGPWTVTVPGAVAGWHAILERFGKLGLDRVLWAAIELARSGFEVTPIVAEEWAASAARVARDASAREVFLPGGRSPAAGERFRNPELADVLSAIAADGPGVMYVGSIAERIGAAVEAAGGPLRSSDLAAWEGPEWIEPLRVPFRGVDVFELPPPSQGLVVLEALGIYAGLELRERVERVHASIEALKLAFADARAYVADPRVRAVPVTGILREEYFAERRASLRLDRASQTVPGRPEDTVYVAAVDEEGAVCSLIQSLYDGFGSGVGVPGTGIVLQNRGAGFVMEEDHPNRPEPGKRPYHTIIPAMLGRDGSPAGALGVVGGFMQPQGQFQILQALFEDGLEPQQAVDRPRFRILGGLDVGLERSFDETLASALTARGHLIRELSRFEAGGAQLILRVGDRYVGASDHRKDGIVGAC